MWKSDTRKYLKLIIKDVCSFFLTPCQFVIVIFLRKHPVFPHSARVVRARRPCTDVLRLFRRLELYYYYIIEMLLPNTHRPTCPTSLCYVQVLRWSSERFLLLRPSQEACLANTSAPRVEYHQMSQQRFPQDKSSICFCILVK